jgi:small subunit ribosomal protein S16
MVRIRLRRVGTKHQASYRIVVTDREAARNGRFLEILGDYNPRTHPATVKLEEERLYHWLRHGAQPSESVVQVLKPFGAWDRWLRYRGGEPLETLLKEGTATRPTVDPRTRRSASGGKAGRKTRRKADSSAAEAAPAAPAETA